MNLRRYVLLHVDSLALACLYTVSRAATLAVVDHCRTTPRVDLWPPLERVQEGLSDRTCREDEWCADFGVAHLAHSLSYRFPSRNARLTVVACWDARALDQWFSPAYSRGQKMACDYLVADSRRLRVYALLLEAWDLGLLQVVDVARACTNLARVAMSSARIGYATLLRFPALRELTLTSGSGSSSGSSSGSGSGNLGPVTYQAINMMRPLPPSASLAKFGDESATSESSRIARLSLKAVDRAFVLAPDVDFSHIRSLTLHIVEPPRRRLSTVRSDCLCATRLVAQLAACAAQLEELDLTVELSKEPSPSPPSPRLVTSTETPGPLSPSESPLLHLPVLRRLKISADCGDPWRLRFATPQLRHLSCRALDLAHFAALLDSTGDALLVVSYVLRQEDAVAAVSLSSEFGLHSVGHPTSRVLATQLKNGRFRQLRALKCDDSPLDRECLQLLSRHSPHLRMLRVNTVGCSVADLAECLRGFPQLGRLEVLDMLRPTPAAPLPWFAPSDPVAVYFPPPHVSARPAAATAAAADVTPPIAPVHLPELRTLSWEIAPLNDLAVWLRAPALGTVRLSVDATFPALAVHGATAHAAFGLVLLQFPRLEVATLRPVGPWVWSRQSSGGVGSGSFVDDGHRSLMSSASSSSSASHVPVPIVMTTEQLTRDGGDGGGGQRSSPTGGGAHLVPRASGLRDLCLVLGDPVPLPAMARLIASIHPSPVGLLRWSPPPLSAAQDTTQDDQGREKKSDVGEGGSGDNGVGGGGGGGGGAETDPALAGTVEFEEMDADFAWIETLALTVGERLERLTVVFTGDVTCLQWPQLVTALVRSASRFAALVQLSIVRHDTRIGDGDPGGLAEPPLPDNMAFRLGYLGRALPQRLRHFSVPAIGFADTTITNTMLAARGVVLRSA